MRKKKVKIRVSKAQKAGLILPVARIERYLRAGQWNPRTSPLSAVYISATLEHILRRILAQSMAWADAMKRVRITPLFIALAVKADPDLNDLLGNTMFKDGRPAEFVAVF
ncbi:histone H2A [Penaeus vannamei]|uniref:Histone H2A n=1 Tax=Penaeus vannamei TaxID=6689 RepID=A0A423TU26_PENVA|nr:histone H2A.v1-like [Penaeus vannamei]ROT79966.1 histone H2A [Penaeus vannamei]